MIPPPPRAGGEAHRRERDSGEEEEEEEGGRFPAQYSLFSHFSMDTDVWHMERLLQGGGRDGKFSISPCFSCTRC